MTIHTPEELRAAVREHYAQAATAAGGCCSGSAPESSAFGQALYDISDRSTLPEGALTASLGCGTPTALVDLHDGEVVLDLGSGGGIDVLLSARRVAPSGKAYGLDMTPEMHQLAQRNQEQAGVDNAEFLLGTMEEVPLPDDSVDVVISNCVVNLAADKSQVLREARRVLRPGGRLAITDMVLRHPLPPVADGLFRLWAGCVAGALTEAEVVDELAAVGFADVGLETVRVLDRRELAELAGDDSAVSDEILDALDGVVTSAFIRAAVPA